MTKEETIKDGIDVSGIANQLECLTVQYDKVVEQNKQLQQELREETVERVRLKAQYDKVVEQNRQLQAELREKTAECGELKIKLMQKDEVNAFFNTPIEGWSSDPCKICESKNEKIAYENEIEILKEELKEYEDILDSRQREWEEENERYIQVLDEIEMICEAQDLKADWTSLEILDLIKKAKDGEE